MSRKRNRTPGGPAAYTKLVSGIYESIYAPGALTIAAIEAERSARKRLRKPTKDESPDERRQRWRENAADRRATLRALGLPAKGRLTREQKRHLQIERDRQVTQALLGRETPEYLERQRALHREQQKRWAAKNKEKVADSQRRWKEKNPDYHRQADRDRYAADPEKFKARSRSRRAKRSVV